MQERARRLLGNPAIAVRHSRHGALEEAKHRAHAVHFVERCNEVHLRCAGICEADFDAASDQRANETLRAVHFLLFTHAFLPAAMTLLSLSAAIWARS